MHPPERLFNQYKERVFAEIMKEKKRQSHFPQSKPCLAVIINSLSAEVRGNQHIMFSCLRVCVFWATLFNIGSLYVGTQCWWQAGYRSYDGQVLYKPYDWWKAFGFDNSTPWTYGWSGMKWEGCCQSPGCMNSSTSCLLFKGFTTCNQINIVDKESVVFVEVCFIMNYSICRY